MGSFQISPLGETTKQADERTTPGVDERNSGKEEAVCRLYGAGNDSGSSQGALGSVVFEQEASFLPFLLIFPLI